MNASQAQLPETYEDTEKADQSSSQQELLHPVVLPLLELLLEAGALKAKLRRFPPIVASRR